MLMARTTLQFQNHGETNFSQEGEVATETSIPTTSLEEDLLTRSEAFHKIYQSIMDKYDRKFSRQENLGMTYNLEDPKVLDAQLKSSAMASNEKLLPFLHKKSHFNFNPDKEAALELHGKLSAAKGYISWDEECKSPHHQPFSAIENELSSDEEECSDSIRSTRSQQKSCNKKKTRKRKRSEMNSTPFRDFFSATVGYAIDSSYLTSDNSDVENDPRQHSHSAKQSWKRDILESGYYDSDDYTTCSSKVKATPVRLPPLSEDRDDDNDDSASESEASVEMDSSFYDN